jgi:DNA-binding beta-propeller fold protein YncE
MKLALAVLALVVASPAPTLPGAKAIRSCAGAGPYWPTQTLALTPGFAWVACKEQQRVLRVPLQPGRSRSIPAAGQPIAVLSAFGAVWALDTGGTVSRIDSKTARITARLQTGASAPYNLWAGAGSLWSVDDQTGEVLRIDPIARKVTKRIPVGDGAADLVSRGERVWVINHRDRGLVLIDASTNRPTRLTTVPGDAPERIVWSAASLWVTGRGTDLLRLDPETGAVQATIEIGVGGIDVVAAGGALWVPTRAAAADGRGFPTMTWLRRIDPASGKVTTPVKTSRRIDVHGLVAYRRGVLFSDNTGGFLYAVPR